MGGAHHIGPRLGDGLIFEVSGLQLDAKSAQVNYPLELHNSNSSHGYILLSSSMVTNREQGRPAMWPTLCSVPLMAAVSGWHGYDR